MLLIGIGPKLALVPALKITASQDMAAKRRGAAQDAGHGRGGRPGLPGELLRALLHSTVALLSIAGAVILLVPAAGMVFRQPSSGGQRAEGKTRRG